MGGLEAGGFGVDLSDGKVGEVDVKEVVVGWSQDRLLQPRLVEDAGAEAIRLSFRSSGKKAAVVFGWMPGAGRAELLTAGPAR